MFIDNIRISCPMSTRRAVLLSAALLLAGCGYVPLITPYRMEIQQGNMVNQEMVSKLAVGMTKEQVRFILGTPLIVDPFRVDRWDYVFSRQQENRTEVEKRRVVVFFEDNKLKRLEGDVVAAGARDAGDAPAAK